MMFKERSKSEASVGRPEWGWGGGGLGGMTGRRESRPGIGDKWHMLKELKESQVAGEQSRGTYRTRLGVGGRQGTRHAGPGGVTFP